jgi:predicted transcriptional regulator
MSAPVGYYQKLCVEAECGMILCESVLYLSVLVH